MSARPSPALVIAIMALVAAVAGTAVAADPLAGTSLSKKKTKKIARKEADKRITARAPDLSVAEAANADTLDGKSASDLETSSGFAQRVDPPLALAATDQTVVSTQVTTTGTRVLAVASTRLEAGGAADAQASCRIRIAGVASGTYLHDILDSTTTSDRSTMSLTFARELPAGTHAVALQCHETSGSVTAELAGLSAWAVGS